MCQKCTDDKYQYCNHCYKRVGAGHVVRFRRKQGVTGEGSESLGMIIL